VAHLYRVQGKDMIEVEQLVAGEIGAIAKVDEIVFDSVLHDSHDEDHIHLAPLRLPRPMVGLAVETLKKGDEQRLFDVLGKLAQEDPTFLVERHPATHETVIRGLGDGHLASKLERMAQQYKLEVSTRPPAIPYRETIAARRKPCIGTKSSPAVPGSSVRCICGSSRCCVAPVLNSSMPSRAG